MTEEWRPRRVGRGSVGQRGGPRARRPRPSASPPAHAPGCLPLPGGSAADGLRTPASAPYPISLSHTTTTAAWHPAASHSSPTPATHHARHASVTLPLCPHPQAWRSRTLHPPPTPTGKSLKPKTRADHRNEALGLFPHHRKQSVDTPMDEKVRSLRAGGRPCPPWPKPSRTPVTLWRILLHPSSHTAALTSTRPPRCAPRSRACAPQCPR